VTTNGAREFLDRSHAGFSQRAWEAAWAGHGGESTSKGIVPFDNDAMLRQACADLDDWPQRWQYQAAASRRASPLLRRSSLSCSTYCGAKPPKPPPIATDATCGISVVN